MASTSSLPTRLILRTVFNMVVVWLMAEFLSEYFQLSGGIAAVIIVGALITLLNLLARPILSLITMPLKLFATILALMIVNGVFVQLVHVITSKMDPTLVRLEIFGGLLGWTIVAMVFGITNWVAQKSLHG